MQHGEVVSVPVPILMSDRLAPLEKIAYMQLVHQACLGEKSSEGGQASFRGGRAAYDASVEAFGGFALVPESVFFSTRLPGLEKILYALLCMYDQKEGRHSPDLDHLKDQVPCSREELLQAFSLLQDLGLVGDLSIIKRHEQAFLDCFRVEPITPEIIARLHPENQT